MSKLFNPERKGKLKRPLSWATISFATFLHTLSVENFLSLSLHNQGNCSVGKAKRDIISTRQEENQEFNKSILPSEELTLKSIIRAEICTYYFENKLLESCDMFLRASFSWTLLYTRVQRKISCRRSNATTKREEANLQSVTGRFFMVEIAQHLAWFSGDTGVPCQAVCVSSVRPPRREGGSSVDPFHGRTIVDNERRRHNVQHQI